MSSTLIYCEKCGYIGDSLFWNAEEKGCFSCHTQGTTKLVPEKYLNDGKYGINKDLKEEFIENVIKTSPNFDQSAWDRRVGYQETRKHYDEMLRNEMKEQSNVPKCPTCSSTNIKRISGTSKVASVAMFGLLSQKVKKTFHCNNCDYEW